MSKNPRYRSRTSSGAGDSMSATLLGVGDESVETDRDSLQLCPGSQVGAKEKKSDYAEKSERNSDDCHFTEIHRMCWSASGLSTPTSLCPGDDLGRRGSGS